MLAGMTTLMSPWIVGNPKISAESGVSDTPRLAEAGTFIRSVETVQCFTML